MIQIKKFEAELFRLALNPKVQLIVQGSRMDLNVAIISEQSFCDPQSGLIAASLAWLKIDD